MTAIEEAIRKILPIEKWRNEWAINDDCDHGYRLHATGVQQCADELESLIPALVEMVERAHAEAQDPSKKFTYCAYCGHTEPIDVDGSVIATHIRTCEKHPSREWEQEAFALAISAAARIVARHANGRVWPGQPTAQQEILALIKPDESAALAERDRRVRELVEKANQLADTQETTGFPNSAKMLRWFAEALDAALRGAGDEKQP